MAKHCLRGAAVRHETMKALIAALAIALLPVAAHAQSSPSLTSSRGQRIGYHGYKELKPRYHTDMDRKTKNQQYEDALKSIPDVKKEADPWKDAR